MLAVTASFLRLVCAGSRGKSTKSIGKEYFCLSYRCESLIRISVVALAVANQMAPIALCLVASFLEDESTGAHKSTRPLLFITISSLYLLDKF